MGLVPLLLALSLSATSQPARGDQSWASTYKNGSGHVGEETCIGDDTDDYLFVWPEVGVDTTGTIFVLDHKLCSIRKYDATGRFMRRFGEQGEGPGDMSESGTHLAVTRDGRVFVGDFGNSRITEFTGDGKYVRDTKLESMTSVERMECGPDGGLWVELKEFDPSDLENYVFRIVRYDRNLHFVDTIDTLASRVAVVAHTETGMVMDFFPYRPGFVWTVTPRGRLVIGRNDEYRLRVLSPDLEVIDTIERNPQRVKVSQGDRDRFSNASRTAARRARRRMIDIGEWKPYIVDLRADSEGYLLVCLYDATDSNTRYDIFAPDGSYRGSSSLGPLKELDVLRNGLTYFVKMSEEKAPQVCWGRRVAGTTQ